MKTPINLDNNNLKNYSLSLIESNWLNNLKKETFARLKTQSIPSKKDEEWRYTNIEPIIKKCVELVSKKIIINLMSFYGFLL